MTAGFIPLAPFVVVPEGPRPPVPGGAGIRISWPVAGTVEDRTVFMAGRRESAAFGGVAQV
jgi:hypothetical protein